MSKCKCVVFNHAWQIIGLVRAQICVLGYYRHALKSDHGTCKVQPHL